MHEAYQQANGGGSTVVGCSFAIVTAVTLISILRHRWWSEPCEEHQLLGGESTVAASAASHQVSADQPSASCKSVQTEQSAVLEVEADEQKELNRQLMTRERHMKQYIQLLQRQLEKRSNEAVVNAAKLREVDLKLAEIPSSDTLKPISSLHQHQLDVEPEYKSHIRDKYEKLSEKLDAGKTAKYLYQQGALNKKEFEEIQQLSNSDRPLKAAEELLNILLTQTEDFYDCFLDSLRKTDQLHVHRLIVLNGYDPGVECTSWIREHYIFLLDKLDSVLSGLVSYLYQYEVIDQVEYDDVRSERTAAKQNERLLSILGRKSHKNIQKFFSVLDVTGQSHIRKEINGQQDGTDIVDFAADSGKQNCRVEEKFEGVDKNEEQKKVEMLLQRLAEASRRELELNDRQTELVRSNEMLERKLAASQEREQDLGDRLRKLVESREELEGRLAECSRREEELSHRVYGLVQSSATSASHLEQRLTESNGCEAEPGDGAQELVVSNNTPEQHELQITPNYSNSPIKRLRGSGWVVGLACVDDELFVLHQRADNQVEVFSTETSAVDSARLRRFSVDGLGKHRHNDMTSCVRRKCLYISDCTNRCVHKLSVNGEVIGVWPVPDSSTGLSLTPGGNLLVTCRESRRLLELCADNGECVHKLDLLPDIEEPRYAMKLDSQRYIISHCGVIRHRVCVVDAKGRVSLSYGGSPGSEDAELSFPTQMAVDRDDSMFVGDWSNRRVVVLSADLQLVRHIELERQSARLFLDPVTRNLYIGLVNGDVIILQV